jgi:prevent-host-death family protein
MAELIVGVRELKANLSKYMRYVKSGQTVTITERGKIVGRILPEPATLDERLAALQRAGIIRWSGKKPSPTKPIARLRGHKTIADILVENRE